MHRLRFSTLLPLFIFAFFFGTNVFLHTTFGTFFSRDDGFFHARMSHALWHGYDVTMPKFSTQSTHTANLYLGYHAAMSPFVAACGTGDTSCIIHGSEVFHSIILGIFATLLYLIFLRVLRKRQTPEAEALALMVATLMFFVPNFLYRMVIERPIAWNLIFFTGFLYALLEKRERWLFGIACLFALSYSTSFILFIPVGIYAFASLIAKNRSEIRYIVRAGAITAVGLLVGVILHPDTWGYVINAYGSHFVSVWQSIMIPQKIILPEEFSSLAHLLRTSAMNWYWPVAAISLCLTFWSLCLPRSAAYKTILVWTSLTSLFFAALFLVFFRAIDYLLPSLAFATIVSLSIYQDQTQRLRTFIMTHARSLRISAAMFVLILMCIFTMRITSIQNYDPRQDFTEAYNPDLSALVETIRTDYAPGDLVFTTGFGLYNKLIFYDPTITYSMGMDSSFTRLYDEKLFWSIQNATLGRPICGAYKCPD